MISIVGIPYAGSSFRLACYAFIPFGSELNVASSGAKNPLVLSGVNRFRQLFWFLCFGIWLACLHLVLGGIDYASLIGIPWGQVHFRLALACLDPRGAVVTKGTALVGTRLLHSEHTVLFSSQVKPTGRLFAIPMLGMDQRMFRGAWLKIPGLVPVGFSKLTGKEPFPKMAEKLCEQYDIRDGDAIVGVCLGGMLGLEIAQRKRISALFLISSARQPAEIYHLYLALTPLLDLVSDGTASFISRIIPILPVGVQKLLGSTRLPFVKTVWSEFRHWHGCQSRDGVLTWRIHGDRDFLIPTPKQCDLVLPGGHLIAITHSSKCASFVRTRFEHLLETSRRVG